MKRLSAEQLRAAQVAQDYHTLWEQADPLCLFAIRSMRRQKVEKLTITDDMVQDAREAAGRAVRAWDPDKGPFTTYIVNRVRNAIGNHLAKERGGMVGGRDAHGTTGSYEDVTPCDRERAEGLLERMGDVRIARYLMGTIDNFRAWQIVRMRFGFDQEPMTLPEIARATQTPLRSVERLFAKTIKKLAGLVNKS